MSSEDVWRMIRRQEKAVEDLTKLNKMGNASNESLVDAEHRLNRLYNKTKELQEEA